MKTRYVMFLMLFFGLLFFVVSCATSPQITTVEFTQQTEETEDQEFGDGVRIKFITAIGTHNEKQLEVQHQMELFINGGKYEIVRVVTTRCNKSQAHLLSAEIYYRVKK